MFLSRSESFVLNIFYFVILLKRILKQDLLRNRIIIINSNK